MLLLNVSSAVKALASIVEANPSLMGHNMIQQSVELRVLDEAKSVREATLDLVGRYIIQDVRLAPKYYKGRFIFVLYCIYKCYV